MRLTRTVPSSPFAIRLCVESTGGPTIVRSTFVRARSGLPREMAAPTDDSHPAGGSSLGRRRSGFGRGRSDDSQCPPGRTFRDGEPAGRPDAAAIGTHARACAATAHR